MERARIRTLYPGSFCQALASAHCHNNSPRQRPHFPTRAWAKDTRSGREHSYSHHPRPAAAARSMQPWDFPTSLWRLMGQGEAVWVETGGHTQGAAWWTLKIWKPRTFVNQSRHQPNVQPVPGLVHLWHHPPHPALPHTPGPWHRLPAGPLPHPGRCIPLDRCTTCPSSDRQHPVPCNPLSQHLAEFALNLFICGVLFKASLLRNTDSFGFHQILSV